MNWFRRLGSTPPSADPADPRASGSPTPADVPHLPHLEGAAPGLTALFEGLEAGSGRSVLDLGRAVGAKLDLYATVARRMHFADLLEKGAGSDPWAMALSEIPSDPESPFDLVFAWDILDRMPPELHPELVERLTRTVGAKGRLHLLVAASEPALPDLFRFTPAGPGRLRYDPTGIPRPPHPRLHPAEVERVLAPFRVSRAFTLKVGFREFVASR